MQTTMMYESYSLYWSQRAHLSLLQALGRSKCRRRSPDSHRRREPLGRRSRSTDTISPAPEVSFNGLAATNVMVDPTNRFITVNVPAGAEVGKTRSRSRQRAERCTQHPTSR